MNIIRGERFTFPDQRSLCENIVTGEHKSEDESFVTRTRVSAGWSIYEPHFHMIALHLGTPVPVLHRLYEQEKLYHFRPDDTFWSPAGAALESAHPIATDTLYMHLNPSHLRRVGSSIGVDMDQVELRNDLGARDAVIARIGREMLQELLEPGLGGRVYTDALMTQLCIHLIRYYGVGVEMMKDRVSAKPNRELKTAIDFMQAHLSDNLSLAQIAAVEYLTPYHFSRLFKQIYGMPPHQYIIQERVAWAAELLKNPRLTVSDVALTVGFSNHSHLIRHFKRLTGTTPRADRQKSTQDSAIT